MVSQASQLEFSSSNNEFADSVRAIVVAMFNSRTTELPDGWLYAQYSFAEADPDLSAIVLPDGSLLRGVPKNADIASLTSDDIVLLAVPRNGPTCIICKVIGNFAVYEEP